MRPGFRACFQQFLNQWPHSESGAMRLAMRVDCQGQVIAIHATVRGLSPDAAACMFRVAADKRFAPPEGGASTVNVPVTFVRTEPAKPR